MPKVVLVFACTISLLASPESAEPSFASAVKALRAGDAQTACNVAQKLVETRPSDVQAWLLLGTSLFDLRRNRDSLGAFHRALALQPNSLAALEGAAQAAYGIGSPETQQLLTRLLAVDPQNETAHAMRGALAFRAGKCAEAVNHFQRAPNALAGHADALSEYGICLVDVHQTEAAIPVFERIVQLQPDRWQSRYNLGLALYRARQYSKSAEILKPLASISTPGSEALNLLAAAYEASHDTERAVATLYQAIAADPEDVRNYLDLATLCMEHSAEQTGIDVVNAALKKLPDALELYLERAVLYVQIGKYAEAQADFDEVDRRSPQQTLATLGRGVALLQTDQPAKSLELIRARLKTAPNDATLHYLLAEVLSRNDAVPGQPAFQEALAAAERAVELKSEFVPAHDLLAGLLLKSGELNRSIDESQRALAIDATDRTAVYHLLAAWRQRGDAYEVAKITKRLRTLIEQARLEQTEHNKFRIAEKSN